MKRNYASGVENDVQFFVGTEVEKTPAYGLKTLFVTGLQDPVDIEKWYVQEGCDHIFFGANHSYQPETPGDYEAWEEMIEHFLEEDILCTLDIPLHVAEEFLDGPLVEYDHFIPQLRVVIPYIDQWNYNAMIKIDDKGFKASNPGVWCHSIHDLKDRTKFTDWAKYGLDKVIE